MLTVHMVEQQTRNQNKVTTKSHQIAQFKLEKDIERIMFYVDYDGSSEFSIG